MRGLIRSTDEYVPLSSTIEELVASPVVNLERHVGSGLLLNCNISHGVPGESWLSMAFVQGGKKRPGRSTDSSRPTAGSALIRQMTERGDAKTVVTRRKGAYGMQNDTA